MKEVGQSFVMYASFLEAAEMLGDKEFKECVLKMRDYALKGEDVHSSNPVVEAILLLSKPNIKAAKVRYQKAVDAGDTGKNDG